MAKKSGKDVVMAVDIGIAEADRKGIAEGLKHCSPTPTGCT